MAVTRRECGRSRDKSGRRAGRRNKRKKKEEHVSLLLSLSFFLIPRLVDCSGIARREPEREQGRHFED